MPIIIPILLVASGVSIAVALALASGDRPVPVHEPDLPPDAPPPAGFPKSTRYKLIDKILPLLKQAADKSGIPLGLIIGWIARESGGKISETTSMGERGYFQLNPGEQKKVGYTDTDRLSSDPVYSINAGLALIGTYMGVVDKLGIASKGSEYYWRLVKLCHTMGTGSVQKIVKMADETNSWAGLENYALDHEKEILHATGHSPHKWFPFIDNIVAIGRPFGFGSADAVVGASLFSDIPDPLDCLDALS